MLSRIQLLKFAAAGSVVACMLGTPAQADELAQNLGPVGPHEPILTEVGSERVMAFYEPDNGRCAVHAVVFDKTDAYTGMTTAARVRVSLNPREIVHIDSANNRVRSSRSVCSAVKMLKSLRSSTPTAWLPPASRSSHPHYPSKPVHRAYDGEARKLLVSFPASLYWALDAQLFEAQLSTTWRIPAPAAAS